jgi:hypothetical protein
MSRSSFCYENLVDLSIDLQCFLCSICFSLKVCIHDIKCQCLLRYDIKGDCHTLDPGVLWAYQCGTSKLTWEAGERLSSGQKLAPSVCSLGC